MILAMCVLGMTFRFIYLAVFGTGFDDAWHHHFWLGVISDEVVLPLEMVLMVPVMVVVMGLRSDEYAGHPRTAPSPGPGARPPRET